MIKVLSDDQLGRYADPEYSKWLINHTTDEVADDINSMAAELLERRAMVEQLKKELVEIFRLARERLPHVH